MSFLVWNVVSWAWKHGSSKIKSYLICFQNWHIFIEMNVTDFDVPTVYSIKPLEPLFLFLLVVFLLLVVHFIFLYSIALCCCFKADIYKCILCWHIVCCIQLKSCIIHKPPTTNLNRRATFVLWHGLLYLLLLYIWNCKCIYFLPMVFLFKSSPWHRAWQNRTRTFSVCL